MRKLRKKILVVIVGFVVSILLLEIGLRVVGYVHLRHTKNKKAVSKEDYVILCLGDSYTEGAGAPQGEGYPRHLQSLINKKYEHNKEITVINKGISSYNTTQILNKFENEMEKVHPDLVILLAGGANRWNFWGYRRYSNRGNFLSQIKDFLYEIKVYKLIKLWIYNLENNIESRILKEKANNKKANKMNERIKKLRNLGYKYRRKGKYYKAIDCFKKILEISPNNSPACLNIAMIYAWNLSINRKKEDKNYRKLAKKWVKRAIELNPKSFKAFNIFVKLYRAGIVSYEEYMTLLSDFKDRVPIAGDILAISKNKSKYEIGNEVLQWVYSDIQKFISLCRSKNINLIIQNYPYPRKINPLLKIIANKNSIPFVNNLSVFENMWRKGKKKKNYYTPNTHCTSKGYKVVAKNIYKKIKKERILNLN